MADEDKHLDWISTYLEKLQQAGNTEIADYIQKWGDIENKTYLEFTNKLLSSGDEYFQELGKAIEENIQRYEFRWKRFLQAETAATA
jgi:hypothetical protein